MLIETIKKQSSVVSKTSTTDETDKVQTPSFADRHFGPSENEIKDMLKTIGVESLEELIRQAVPAEVLNMEPPHHWPQPLSESQLIGVTRKKAEKNRVLKNYIGQGFFECLPLAVTNRNIIKNPCWYTAYTPYQSEISQGRLEALLNFQTLICDLTGMELSNASLLDESSAAGEALSMALNVSKKPSARTLFVDENTYDHTLAVMKTRADSLGVCFQKGNILKDEISKDVYAVFFQYPFMDGSIVDLKSKIQELKEKNILILVSTDLLANCLIQPPGEWGADIVTGSAGRLGLPLFYGGPHASFLACKKEFSKSIPGRIVGVSKDRHNNPALRLCLQTREQHIRRQAATSNICTSQVLPAILTSMYAVYHGPSGLKAIAQSIHQQTLYLYKNLKQQGCNIINSSFFDTLTCEMPSPQIQKIKSLSEKQGINFGYPAENRVQISVGEGRTKQDMDEVIRIFQTLKLPSSQTAVQNLKLNWPPSLTRTSSFMQHPVFQKHQSETKLIRYIHFLQNKDLSLAHSMIPLGSCTMKLNATTELQPMTWKGFADIHPFAPKNQVQGSLEIFKELEDFLCKLTGFSAFSLQPNAGSQGEYAGLMIFRKYHQSIKEPHRNICLIPSSAHGTNPASARMAGLQVVTVKCHEQGGIDEDDLKEKAELHSKNLSCLMITYPSTCGVFEKNIPKICQLIHHHGGLVYFDGANMNALTGLCQPAQLGCDAGHLNLHKTFCIPHGGGGPGSGPIGVCQKLKKFLPSHPFLENNFYEKPKTFSCENTFTLSASPFGNAGVLSIPWAYIQMMGFHGLKKASQIAVLNANYIKQKLAPHYRILYTGPGGFNAHECIIDLRKFKFSCEVDVVDIAKRLMDYGFHAPTMSWPIPGTLMIEPTESEDKEEMDRFCTALISIRKEIAEIEEGKWSQKNNMLKNAPHTIEDLQKEKWPFPYSKKQACQPLPYLKEKKFWPSVSRVEEAYGDIHLFCSCS